LYTDYNATTNTFTGAHQATNTAGNVTLIPFAATTQAQWQDNAVIIDQGKGTHVDMAIDGQNTIHLAYYDASNGGLYYARIPATGTDTAANIRPNVTKNASNIATSGVTKVKVDTYLSAGTKIMINVRQQGSNYVPYISYTHASFAETRNSVRIAWRTDFTSSTYEGTDASDTFTGKWEVMTVPASRTPVSDEFVCNGVPTAVSGWASPAGTTTTATDALRGYTNNGNPNGTSYANRTVIVGYMTGDWYEGAVLKSNLWTP
jgi:hypothetical protein